MFAIATLTVDMTNPYEAPTSSESEPVDPVEAAKRRLSRPATALLTMASIHSVFPAVGLISCGFAWLHGNLSLTDALPTVVIQLTQLVLLILIAIGAGRMGHLKSLKMATLGAVLACIPVVTPFVVAGIPFGVWSLVLLNDPNVARVFPQNSPA